MSGGFSTVVLPGGAKLAYEILGSLHLGQAEPIVLICGMSSIRSDYERLSYTLMKTRPVLIYDHCGFGDSSLSPGTQEPVTIESYARDLAFLLQHLGWKNITLCGFSMGGVIAQQMLVLPYHPVDPTPLNFEVTHVLLAGTRSAVHSVGLPITPPSLNKKRTPEERVAITRRVMESLFDPMWIQENNPRFQHLLTRVIRALDKKPSELIIKQMIALQNFDFKNLLYKLPAAVQIMIIHGRLDQVIPFYYGEIKKWLPRAQFVERGNSRGQVPSFEFGHYWYEYFDAEIWRDVIDVFIG
ncbi:Alpha/Beta hydrolase protein [Cyathus striatus]|nr:Alpha/Beta hydrolase protein [Cyathus striatus]